MKRSPIELNDLVRLHRQLQIDNAVSLNQLQTRDHSIGKQCGPLSDLACLRYWLDQVSPLANHEQQHRKCFENSVSFWMIALGAVFGILTMASLMLVGPQVINVQLFLSQIIGGQFFLLALTLAVGFSSSIGLTHQLPFENLNPVRIFLNRSLRKLLGDIRWKNIGEVIRFALLRWGQQFGVAFNIGGIAAFLVVLTAADHSFGWSSTFNFSNDAILSFVNTMSLPWSFFWPEASLSLDVIESSRVLALQTSFSAEHVKNMRAWWPFLLACIIFYGLLPRLILLLIFIRVYRKKLAYHFSHYPGAQLVLTRLKEPQIKTQSRIETDAIQKHGAPLQQSIPSGHYRLISWANSVGSNPDQVSSMDFSPSDFEMAGLNLEADQELLNTFTQTQARGIVVAVKSWEPPLAELEDFLKKIDSNVEVHLLLLTLPNKPASTAEIEDWQQFSYRTNAHLLLGNDPITPSSTVENPGKDS